MFFLRRAGLSLAALLAAALVVRAAHTEAIEPPGGATTVPPTQPAVPGAPVVPGSATPSPAATVPGAPAPVQPPVSVPGTPTPTPGSLPATVTPGQAVPPTASLAAPGSVPPPLGTPIPENSETEKALEKSVVQIFTSYQEPNWSQPWIFDLARRASGTGFVIDGDRIMTNAHVVAWTTELIVRKYHDPTPYFARVEFVGHDVDLAVLKIINPMTHEDDPHSAFWDGMKPLVFGTLPKVRSTVVTYGFPAGGQQISYTRGVVSRIEVEGYVHIGNKAFLACQTDAAINPGNSGGPVIQDDKVVGVAFEGISGLQSTGYFIPTVIIHHFLDDIKDGTYDGVPEAGLRLAALQNPAYRRMLKLPENSHQGVRIDQIMDIPTTQALLKPNDVIMQIGDYPVDEDGTITFEGNTVGVSAAVDLAQNGDTIPLKVWRDGQMVDIKLPVKVDNADYAQGNQYDVPPPYYVYGGLVFTPLSLDYLKTFGSDWSDSAGRGLIYELAYRHIEDPKEWRPQPVVLTSILDASVNANFSTRGQAMVDKINGIRIERLSDVPKAFAAAKDKESIIEFLPDHHFEVISQEEAEKTNDQILETYHVLDTAGEPQQSRQ